MTRGQRARALASRPYGLDIEKDETTQGSPVYVATHPELPGCMAQGATVEEAVSELKAAAFEYILSLLEDGQPIPEPSASIRATAGPTTGPA